MRRILWLLVGTVFSGHAASPTFDRMKSFIDGIKVVDIHEHIGLDTASLVGSRYQNIGRMFSAKDVNFYSILASDYLPGDLVSAGAPPIPIDKVLAGDLNGLWQTYGPYMDFCRNTTYYAQLVDTFRLLYGFREPYFTEANIAKLSQSIAENYHDKQRWVAKAFKKAGFDIMVLDQSWDQFKTAADFPRFVPIMRIDHYMMAISHREEYEKAGADPRNNPFFEARKEGVGIHTLDDYLAFADRWYRIFSVKRLGPSAAWRISGPSILRMFLWSARGACSRSHQVR